MAQRRTTPAWVWLLTVAWSLFVLAGAAAHWPAMPLDMSASDGETLTALNSARASLILRSGLLAAAGALVIALIGRWLARRSG